MKNQEKTNAATISSPNWLSAHKEWLLLVGLVVWGYLFITFFPLPYLGISLTLFALAGFAMAYGYLRSGGTPLAKSGSVYLAVAAVLAISFALFENRMIKPLLFLLLPCLFACWLIHSVQSRPLEAWDIADSLRMLIVKPLENWKDKFSVFTIKEQNRSQVKFVIIGIVVAIPILALAASLLMEADQNFSNLVQKVSGDFFGQFGSTLFRLVAACFVAAYFLSMLMSAAKPKEKGEAPKLPQLNNTVISIVLGALCLLYLLFVVVQALSVAGVFQGTARSASFYSAYARDGFFELCLVTILNLVVFLTAQIFREEKPRSTRILLTLLGVLTLALIVTAIVKMSLYMDHYGLTLLRVQTTWFMASLFLVFGMLIVWQWKSFAVFKSIAILAVVSVLAASYANIGGLVARGNVDRVLQGSLDQLDMTQYEDFPYEATPHLIRLHEQTDKREIQAEIEAFFVQLNSNDDFSRGETRWYERTVQQIMARNEIIDFWKQVGEEKEVTLQTSRP